MVPTTTTATTLRVPPADEASENQGLFGSQLYFALIACLCTCLVVLVIAVAAHIFLRRWRSANLKAPSDRELEPSLEWDYHDEGTGGILPVGRRNREHQTPNEVLEQMFGSSVASCRGDEQSQISLPTATDFTDKDSVVGYTLLSERFMTSTTDSSSGSGATAYNSTTL